MKPLTFLSSFFLLLLLFSQVCISQPGWEWSYPKPTGNPIYCIRFLNQATGYIVCEYGEIHKTTNAAFSWERQYSGINSPLLSICLVDANIMYCCGYGGIILKSTNGGTNWVRQTTGTTIQLNSIDFYNSSTGYAAGAEGIILVTSNGGNTWTTTNVGVPVTFFAIQAVGSGVVYAAGVSGRIYKTTNSGVNWLQQTTGTTSTLLSICFINSLTGYASGSSGSIMKTTNGGVNWAQYVTGTQLSITSINFPDANTGYAVCHNGMIYKTTNSGGNWNVIPVNESRSFITTACYTDINTGYQGGYMLVHQGTGPSYGSLFKTTNGGTNWTSLINYFTSELRDIQFVNAETGYFVGSLPAAIVKTTNAGLSWQRQFLDSNIGFFGLHFLNPTTGYAVGWDRVIFKTTNGGNSWNQLLSAIPSDSSLLMSVYFTDINTGYVVGGWIRPSVHNILLKTTNGGINWFNQVPPVTNRYLFKVQFTDFNTGYAAGGWSGPSGYILKTTNGGINWYDITSVQMPILVSMHFIDENTGLVSGYFENPPSRITLKTTNGGTNWMQMNSNYYADMYFLNSNIGLGVDLNKLSVTTDGGSSWQVQPSFTNYWLLSVYLIDENTGYVTGDGGVILKTTTGGWPISIDPFVNQIPDRFILYQNYPNPFNPVTKIKFDVPTNSIPLLRGVSEGRGVSTRLVIYDILGREIVTLVNDVLEPGSYEAEWDATNYPSGVYFYRLLAGDYTDTKKMVLIK